MAGDGSALTRLLLVLATGVLCYAAVRAGVVWAQVGGVGSYLWPAAGGVALAVLMLWAVARERNRMTELRQAEHALRQSEARKSAILESALDCIVSIDPEGRIIDFNPAAERTFGFTRDQVRGQLLAEKLIPPSLREAHAQGMARFVATGEARVVGRRIEVPALRADGSEVPVELAISMVRDPAGPTFFTAYMRDISQRKEVEAAVRESEEKFRALANTIPQLAWMARPDGWIFWYNQRWYEFTGTTPEQMEGWGWQAVHDPAELPRVVEGFRAAISEGRPWEDTFPLRRHDGVYCWHLSRASPMRDSNGNVTLWFGTNTDITEQREIQAELRSAKEQAEAANAAKDQFLAVLSHELRTPLTPVLTLAELLESRPDLPADVRTDAAIIRRNVSLESRLIDDLLDLTRISRGKLELHPAPVDLHDSVRHVLSMVDADVAEKKLNVQVDLAAGRSRTMADPARLQQIIWNLLKNAVKFTPDNGWIRVRTRDDGSDRLRLEIIDDGIGIEPDVLPRIFTAFDQGDPSVTRQFGGLGLGLAISKRLADLHGGSLTAQSEGRGRGATLVLELPATQAREPGNGEHPPTSEPTGRPLRILLVEDHVDTAKVMLRLLRRTGHHVAHADSVASALALAESERFDVLLSDVGLPDGSGHDLMRSLRDRPDMRGIALSGFGMEDDVRRSLDAGFALHLIKPVSLERLERAIHDVAAKKPSPELNDRYSEAVDGSGDSMSR